MVSKLVIQNNAGRLIIVYVKSADGFVEGMVPVFRAGY